MTSKIPSKCQRVIKNKAPPHFSVWLSFWSTPKTKTKQKNKEGTAPAFPFGLPQRSHPPGPCPSPARSLVSTETQPSTGLMMRTRRPGSPTHCPARRVFFRRKIAAPRRKGKNVGGGFLGWFVFFFLVYIYIYNYGASSGVPWGVAVRNTRHFQGVPVVFRFGTPGNSPGVPGISLENQPPDMLFWNLVVSFS